MEDKASDLDIFDGLAAKKSRPAPGPSIPPPPGSRIPGAPPPPSMTRQKALDLATPMPGSPLPPPPPTSRAATGPVPPPPSVTGAPPPPPAFPVVGAPPPAFPAIASPPPPPPFASALSTPLPASPPAPNLFAPPPPPGLSVPPPPPPPLGSLKRSEEEPTPPAAAKANGKAGVEIDWDDEDEATTVFDRGQEDASRSLLRSAPPPPPAAGVPAPTRPPAPPPVLGAPLPGSRSPTLSRSLPAPAPSLPRPAPLPARPTSSLPAPMPAMNATLTSESGFGRSKRTPLMIGGVVVAVAAVVGLVVSMMPSQGSLVVTVAGPGNKPVSELQVLVDGEKRCDRSPCQVKDLPAGTHLVRVTAPGYEQTADQAIKVNSGDEAVHNVTLTRSGGSGLTVRAEGRGLKLIVDGKDIGPLPQELPDLAPGEHTVRIEGGDRYETFEKRVTIEAGQLNTLEPKLTVKKGLATIKPGQNAEDARVVLVSGNERRPVPQLPLAVDIPVDKGYRIVATKRGFDDFEQKLEFEDGQAERTFVIDLVPSATSNTDAAVATRAPAPVSAPPREAPAAPAPAPKAASGGTLNLSSIPVSNVILDGKPLGPTPKLGVSVTPGTHTVIFVHAELGRKAKSVTVAAGKTVPVVAKFK